MKSYNFTDIKDVCKLLGRHSVTSEGIYFDYSAATLEFNLECEGEVSIFATLSSPLWFSVIVDGEERRVAADRGEQKIILAEGLKKGEHSFSLIRQTYVASGPMTLKTLAFEGKFLAPPAKKAKFIEFIGDSITCGYGTRGVVGETHTDETDDATRSYAYRTAKNLDVDYMMTAISGMGIAYGYTTFTVNEVYPLQNFFRSKTEPYTFERKPDLVVINLGTNDYSKWQHERADAVEHFQSELRILIDTVYANYGFDHCPVVFCYGAMNPNGAPEIHAVVEEYASRGARMTTVHLTEDHGGVDYHPSNEGALRESEDLTAYLKNLEF